MFQVLYNFTGGSDGYAPTSAPVADQAGNLYGTTYFGGGSTTCGSGCGTVFKLSVPVRNGAWKETVLYRFTGGSDGALPYAGLVLDATGNLYGAAAAGGTATCSDGSAGCGVIFELSPPLHRVALGPKLCCTFLRGAMAVTRRRV